MFVNKLKNKFFVMNKWLIYKIIAMFQKNKNRSYIYERYKLLVAGARGV